MSICEPREDKSGLRVYLRTPWRVPRMHASFTAFRLRAESPHAAPHGAALVVRLRRFRAHRNLYFRRRLPHGHVRGHGHRLGRAEHHV
eukprot:1268736-Rhodomonas_salina.1